MRFPLPTSRPGKQKPFPLHEIAEAQDAESVSSINRENQVRYMTVTAGVDNDHNIGLVSRELEEKLAAYEVPEGYTVEIQGETETINSAMNDLILMIVLAVVFIYLIMVAQFQSLLSPLSSCLPFLWPSPAAFWLLWLTGSPLISIIAMLGFLMLAGVVVNNGIVFVDYVNQLRLEGVDKKDALIQTGRTRLRPILMTALTTIFSYGHHGSGPGRRCGNDPAHGYRHHWRPHLRHPADLACGAGALRRIP